VGRKAAGLPQVQCPQCGAANDSRAPDYPFCVGCQENLAKCGYCHWFDERAVECTNAAVAGEFEVGSEVAPPCGYHTPRVVLRAKREGRLALVVVLGLAAAVFALGYGFFKLLQPIAPPPSPKGQIQLAVEADYRGAAVGQTFKVTAQIYNASDEVASGVRFEIEKRFLEQFRLAQVTPRPTGETQSAKWHVMYYPEMNPREQRTIILELVPKRSGTFHLVLQVTSGESAKHGMADLPIRVKGSSVQVRDGRSEET
jgi:hypothetical protein